MKKVIRYIPQLLIVAAISLGAGCNGAQTHDDTDRTKSENGSSHPSDKDTSMTDTTRNVTSGVGNDVNSAVSDSGFITKNITDNMTEVQLSKLGLDKASDAKVKNIAKQMVADHTQMLNDLKAAAKAKNLAVPTDNGTAAAHAQTMSGASGKDFDKQWVSHMLEMHEAKLAELATAISQTTSGEVKALATKAQPKVKAHRDMLAQMNGAQ